VIDDDVAGVARNSIQSLRAAAGLATERGHETIEAEDILDKHYDGRSGRERSEQRSEYLPDL
jgi:hypothetical protein